MAERASYYGAKAAFNNFLQFPLPDGGPGTGAINPNNPNGHAGALDLGLTVASAITLLFTFMAYLVPIFGAWIADVHIGRYKAIIIGVVIGAVAHVIMVGSAAPALLQAGKSSAMFLVSFFMLAIGAGIFKPNVAPTLLDQYKYQREYTKVLVRISKSFACHLGDSLALRCREHPNQRAYPQYHRVPNFAERRSLRGDR